MPLSPADLMAFAVLASLKAAERERAQTPLILTMVPGAPSTRAPLATTAVGNQARDGLRRERRVAAASLMAVSQIARGDSAAHVLLGNPTLCDLDADEIVGDVRAMWAAYGTPVFGLEIPREGDLWEPR